MIWGDCCLEEEKIRKGGDDTPTCEGVADSKAKGGGWGGARRGPADSATNCAGSPHDVEWGLGRMMPWPPHSPKFWR